MASRSLNRIQLIGNLTRDPELRYTPQGTAVCTFGLATNRSWITEDGERKEEAEFHRIVSWNKLAEICSQFLFKGRRVFVEGRLQTRQWNAQDGTPRQTTEAVINEMIVLDSKRSLEGDISPELSEKPKEQQKKDEERKGKGKKAKASEDKPSSAKASEGKPKEEEEKEEISEDDIPF